MVDKKEAGGELRYFVAGATSAIGKPIISELRSLGHEVFGLTRSQSKVEYIENLGATAYVADVLDPEAIQQALSDIRPEVVVQVLNALPKNGPRKASDFEATNRLRTSGTDNLLAAAINARVSKYVVESMIVGYGQIPLGSPPVTEERPFVQQAPGPDLQPAIDAINHLESTVLGAAQRGLMEGIVLRLGGFYGPGVGSTEYLARLVRRRMMPKIKGQNNVVSMIHIDDAAHGLVAASHNGASGQVYNIVDDQPVSISDFVAELAAVTNAPRPLTVPSWFTRLMGSYLTLVASTNLPVSNFKAKSEIGWTPANPTIREGLRTLVETG
jgi:2-alkyl-3-oxoalkanoate reductase